METRPEQNTDHVKYIQGCCSLHLWIGIVFAAKCFHQAYIGRTSKRNIYFIDHFGLAKVIFVA